MPIYQNGLTFKPVTSNTKATPPRRTKITGWSKHAAARNSKFLYSVYVPALQGVGLSFTFTVGKEVPTAKEFHRWRSLFFKELRRRSSVICYHWVIEWQARGAPHLHGVYYYQPAANDFYPPDGIWCRLASASGALHYGQMVRPIRDTTGWLKYLAKHASRSVNNYQRSPDNVPAGWKSSTGRVWGYGGDWPRVEPFEPTFDSQKQAYSFRRLVIQYLKSTPERDYWEQYLKRAGDKSPFVGLSCFIPSDVSVKLLKQAKSN